MSATEELLKQESYRQKEVKAKKMIQLGLFEQTEEAEFSFDDLTKISTRKYKGVYSLYINESGSLFYVNPLVEDNKGDSDNEVELKPYAYDVIRIDDVTDEEFKEVCSAGAHENTGIILGLIIAQIVMLVVSVAMFIWYLCLGFDSVGVTGFVVYGIGFYPAFGVQLGLLALSIIQYRKFNA